MMFQEPYFIFYHKHPTSALTRFALFEYGSVLGLKPAPTLSQVADAPKASVVTQHPVQHLSLVAENLGLEPNQLETNLEFKASLETPQGLRPVTLVQMTVYDPPPHLENERGMRFIRITEARTLPPTDLELLKRAYETILG